MSDNLTLDGRKYDIGDKVAFTSTEGQQVAGIIHGVRYQQGHYELVGAHHENPYDPKSPVIPGTGQMEVIKGTEDQRHSFEYIIVHEAEHKAWHATEKSNNAHIKAGNHHLTKPLPPLTQHVRIYED